MKYFVAQTLWHSGERRHAYPGERVELGHLSEAEIAKLVEVNVIVPEGEGASRFSKTQSSSAPLPAPVEKTHTSSVPLTPPVESPAKPSKTPARPAEKE